MAAATDVMTPITRRNRPGTKASDMYGWPDEPFEEMDRTLAVQQYIQQQIRADFTNIGAILESPEGQDEGVWKYEHLRQFCMELIGLAVRLQENVTPTNASHFSEDFGKKTVQVHRTRLKDDLIQLFSCPEITRQVLNVRIIDNHGRLEEGEGPGVLRDVLSTFWQHIFASLTLGYVEKVPSIRHDHQKHEWEAIGRVLLYGLKETGYVPVCLSPVFLASCLHGEETITEADLLLSFKSYITPDEREVLERVLSEDFQADDEDLTEFLSSYKCYRKPKPKNIKSLFAELAHQEIIQKPRYIANCWAPVLGVLKEHADFANVESLRQLFLDNKPTAKKVIKALDAKPTSDAEKESLSFLKKFIKSLDAVSLKTFLKFVTGSDVMVLQTISVSFNSVEGIGRTPIANTCGPTL